MRGGIDVDDLPDVEELEIEIEEQGKKIENLEEKVRSLKEDKKYLKEEDEKHTKAWLEQSEEVEELNKTVNKVHALLKEAIKKVPEGSEAHGLLKTAVQELEGSDDETEDECEAVAA